MKKIILIFIMLVSISINLVSNDANDKKTFDIEYIVANINEAIMDRERMLDRFELEHELVANDELSRFLNAIARRESNGNPLAINSYGYMGKYQFGKAALKDVGYKINPKAFKNDPSIFNEAEQDKAMIKYMKRNKKILGKLIKKYKGKIINGVEITESGVYAAAHLAGAGNVIKFLESEGSYNPSDAYGTRLQNYMKNFSGYNFNLDNVNIT